MVDWTMIERSTNVSCVAGSCSIAAIIYFRFALFASFQGLRFKFARVAVAGVAGTHSPKLKDSILPPYYILLLATKIS